MTKSSPKKRRVSKDDREDLTRLIMNGVVSPDKPGAKKTTYSTRLIPDESFVSKTYPGYLDHPSTQGVEYTKHVDQSPTGSIWQALANQVYAEGGFPTWIRDGVSDLDISVYWQMVHYQFVNDGKARMSVRTISRNLARPYRSIQRCIVRLREVGLIVQIEKHSGRRASAFRVLSPSSLEPRILPPRRSDNTFETFGDSVEVTAGSVEVTADNSRGDRAVTQKTKPLKGVVGAVGASAPSATTTRKKKDMPTSNLLTIDELKKNSKQKRRPESIPPKIGLVRKFHAWEVTDEKLEEWIKTSPSLRTAFSRCLGVAKRAGELDQASGAVLPHSLAGDGKIYEYIRNTLTQNPYDVRNPVSAIDTCLGALISGLGALMLKAEELRLRWQQERDDQIERAEFAMLTPWEQDRARIRNHRLGLLVLLTPPRLGCYPKLKEAMESWLDPDSTFKLKPLELIDQNISDYERLTNSLARVFGHGDWIGLGTLTQRRLVEIWFAHGGSSGELLNYMNTFEDSDELKEELEKIASRPF